MTLITDLPALSSPLDTDLYYVSQGATDFKATRAQIVASVQASLDAYITATDATLATITSTYLPLAGGTMSGAITLSGAPTASNHATTKTYVDTQVATKATAADSALTGTPTAPTAAVGTDTTQIATTAFTRAEIADAVFSYTSVTSSPKVLAESESGKIAVNVAGAVAITLPEISTLNTAGNVFYHIQDVGYQANSTTQTITITAGGSDTINNGASSTTITTAGEDVYLYNDGSTSWYSKNIDIPASTTDVGKVRLATTAEAQALSLNTVAVTPSSVSDILDKELYQVTEVGSASKVLAESEAGLISVTYTSSGAVSLTLPDPSALTNPSQTVYEIVDAGGSAGTNNITIDTTAGTIDGQSTFVIDKDRASLKVYNDGTKWISTANTQTAVANSAAVALSTVLGEGNTTGANDITVTSGQQIKSSAGSSELDLRPGLNSAWQITSDAGVYGSSCAWVYGQDSNSAQLALGDGTATAAFDKAAIGVGVFAEGLTTTTGTANSILIQMNDSTNATPASQDHPAIFIGSNGGTINSGVINSVLIGGSGGTISNSNRVMIGGDLELTGSLYGTINSDSAILTNTTGGRIGYGTTAGSNATQTTNRTTAVTLNRPTGKITLVSAAGSATPATFTVNNSVVTAKDAIIINQMTGTDLYEIHITAVAAGSFDVTFFTTGGTTTEQPTFKFVVIAGDDE
jgi:hypothetical protein